MLNDALYYSALNIHMNWVGLGHIAEMMMNNGNEIKEIMNNNENKNKE